MTDLTNATGLRLKRMLPAPWYDDARSVDALLEAEGRELETAGDAIDDVRDARLPQTAPEWGLDRLEAETGLTPSPDQTIDERRERLIAHFRGFGTPTIAKLRNVALSWGYGDIAVIPYPDHPDGPLVILQFIDTRGVPAVMTQFQAQMRDVAQGHWALDYTYRYLIVGELAAWGGTVADLAATGLTVDELKTWEPV